MGSSLRSSSSNASASSSSESPSRYLESEPSRPSKSARATSTSAVGTTSAVHGWRTREEIKILVARGELPALVSPFVVLREERCQHFAWYR